MSSGVWWLIGSASCRSLYQNICLDLALVPVLEFAAERSVLYHAAGCDKCSSEPRCSERVPSAVLLVCHRFCLSSCSDPSCSCSASLIIFQWLFLSLHGCLVPLYGAVRRLEPIIGLLTLRTPPGWGRTSTVPPGPDVGLGLLWFPDVTWCLDLAGWNGSSLVLLWISSPHSQHRSISALIHFEEVGSVKMCF